MKYNEIKTPMKLDESMIQVPSSLKNAVSKVVGSVLLTLLKRQAESTDHDYRLQALDRAMGMVQSKFHNPVLLNDAAFNRVYNTTVDLDFDREQFVQELKNMKLDKNLDRLMNVNQEIQDLALGLKVFDIGSSNEHGYVQPYKGGGMVIAIGISAKLDHPEHDVLNVLGMIDHETQHVVQKTVIKHLEGEDGQHQKVAKGAGHGTSEDFKNYVSSFIEFGPHISDFVSNFARSCELLKMRGVLKSTEELSSSEFQQLMKHLIRITLGADSSMKTFFNTLKERSDDMYKKAWRTVYKKIVPIYEAVANSDVKYSYVDVPVQDIEANLNVMHTLKDTIEKQGIAEITGARGSNAMSIVKMGFTVLGVDCTVTNNNDESYNVVLDFKGESENIDINAKALLAWVDDFDMFTQPGEIFDSLQVIGYTSGPELTQDILDGAMNSVESIIDGSGEVQKNGDVWEVKVPGITFNVLLSEDKKYVRIESPEYNYVRYNVSTLQLYSFFLHFNLNYNEDRQKALNILKVSATFMDTMFRFDGIIGD